MLYTEEAVRAGLRVRDGRRVFYLPEGSRLTPAARDWLRQEGVTVVPHAETPPAAYRTPDGAAFAEKPEHMTHLKGNLLVFKDHPRIAFRGYIDLLEAEIVLCQQACVREGYRVLAVELEEVLGFVRRFIRFDVLDEPVGEVRLCGYSPAELLEYSHYPEKHFGQPHFMLSYTDSPAVAAVNKVRAVVRQTELAAYQAFRDENGAVAREDIILGLNRLSSLFWIFMIKLKAGKYERT